MLRIIAGRLKGKKLAKSDHFKNLRPTKESARENLFNLLASNKNIVATGFELSESNVLDVCAGTGAIAFEAISRGAKSASLIENNFDHVELLHKNQKILDIENVTKILTYNAKKLPKNDEFFDFIFVDPPYEEDYESILLSLLKNSWIQKKAILAVEMSNIGKNLDKFENFSNSNEFINQLELLEKRKYGSSVFYIFVANC